MIHTSSVTGTGVGEDASATFTSYSEFICGKIICIDVEYEATTPAPESDLIISDNQGTDRAILTLTNKVTDGRFYPRLVIDDEVGVSIASNYEYHYANSTLKVVGSQLDEDDVINVIIYWED